MKGLVVRALEISGRWLFERSGAVDTAERIHLDTLGLGAKDRISYTPSGWLTLRRALPRRAVDANDVLIDYGSGKGRVLVQAARYPIKQVIGLEISPELNALASQNVESNRHRLACQDVVLVTADVLEYEPPDDITIAYLYNPFRGEIFAAAITRLIESHDRNPRRVRLIYVNPTEHHQLLATNRFRLVRRLHGIRPGRRWSRTASTYVYEIVPQPGL